MKRFTLLALALAAALPAFSKPSPIFRPVINEAIDSPTGQSQHVFEAHEQWVELARRAMGTGTTGPVTATARVVKRWTQPGCARVELALLFHDADIDPATRQPTGRTMTVGLNTCKDGQPPVESMDLRTVGELLAPPSSAASGPVADMKQRKIP